MSESEQSPETTGRVEDAAAGSDPSTSRRIAIGSQRTGSAPPVPVARYRYVVAPAADAPSPNAKLVDETAVDVASAGMAAGIADVREPPPAPRADEPTDRGGRERKRVSGKPRQEHVPAQATRRVAVPNLRAALDEDLQADFEAALAGVPVDDVLAGETAAKADAPLEPGTRLHGTVLAVGPDTAFLDLGARRQGAMRLGGLVEAGADLPVVGATFEVTVGTRNDEDGLYDVAPANRAVAVEDWSQLQAGMIVEARVKGANKGGLECEVGGLRGFMPASLVSPWRVENLEEMVGQTLESLVTELVPEARRLVLSRRAVIEKQAADAKAKMLETLEPGAELDGIVRNVRDFGAFVDIGNGVEGLVHVSELSWDRVASAADLLTPGQKVRVVVKRIDAQTGRIGLSARDLVESPWKRAAEKYHVGAAVRGTVSRIAQFGAFVRLEPGVEGLVHISELASRHIRSVADVVKEGEAVECRVLAVDPDEQRMSLSIKALAPAPTAREDAAEEPIDEPPPQPPPAKKRSGPLKGGVGGDSQGARFGLRW